MPSCAVCTHDQRKAIEAELLGGKSQRSTARRYALRPAAVQRHVVNHLRANVILNEAREETTVRGQVQKLLDRADAYLRRCEQEGSKLTPAMYREVRGCLETIGRISGEVPTGSQVTVNFFQKLGVESEAHLRELLAFGRATKERGDVDEHEAAHAAAEWLARYFIANPDKRFALLATLGAGESGSILSPAHGAESHQPALNGDAR